MGAILCPEHGTQLMTRMCRHLKRDEVTDVNKVVFDVDGIAFRVYLCSNCRKKIDVDTHHVQSEKSFDDFEELDSNNIFVCNECIKSATA